MQRNPAGLAIALMLFVVLACNFSAKTTNLSSNSDDSTSVPSSTGAISEIHMAKDNGTGGPGDESSVFKETDRTLHCVANLNDPKPGTMLKFAWWIVDSDGTKDQKIRDIDFTTPARENVVHGHLTASRDWSKGKYKVELYVNGNLEKTVAYTIE